MEDEVENTTRCRLLTLPWEDVLVAHILSYLPLRQLVALQRVSKEFHTLIRLFFAKSTSLELVGPCVPKEAFCSLVKDNSGLLKLSLESCSSWLTDEELLPVISRNRRLLTVGLSDCVGLTRHSLGALSLTCLHLRHLAVARCEFVDGPSLRSLADHFGELRSLDLSGCSRLKDDSICYLAKKCVRLAFLSLAVNESITGEAVEEVAKNCRGLEHLDLSCCLRVRDHAIRTVAEYCPKLQSLKVKHCRHVTESSLELLRKRNVLVDIPPPSGSLSLVVHSGPYVNIQQRLKIFLGKSFLNQSGLAHLWI
ncbi:F-box/LRR-repeat protein 15 isoform X3 [Syngnathus typhle]|uniref:F-box/LRR-repeat protein 15 isoform X3 n=1 Tax=Syngnathus typhle TaxID=161592 RepID=UPI002A69CD61|nr:F-box/LRR-repeat protein 15 isoform X3 [Syngnathus typhle]